MRALIICLLLLLYPTLAHAVCNWEYVNKTDIFMSVKHVYNDDRRVTFMIGEYTFNEYAKLYKGSPYLVYDSKDVIRVYKDGINIWVMRENSPMAKSFGATHWPLIIASDRDVVADDVMDILSNCNF